jgi:lipoprotein-anchoring transpeptidase ErfK/SrfK
MPPATGSLRPTFRKRRFVVVVGEWVIEPRFNDRVDGEDYHNKISKDRYIYIHGTNREDLIGQPASAGCVCLSNADVINLYDLIPVGSRVEIIA